MLFRRAAKTLRSKLESLNREGFARSIGVLVGGTAFAQALTVLALPFVTRLYTPSDFSVLAVFASILSIISVAACLRLELAIPMPEYDNDAANLFAVALCASAVVALLSGLVVYFWPAQIIDLVGQPGLRPYLWLLPFGIWLTSSYSAMQFWTTRKKRFGLIAKTRMSQAVGGTGTQIGLGFGGFTPMGLLLGQVINSGAGFFGLGRNAMREDGAALKSINLQGMRQMFQRYDRFPKFSTFESFANTASSQLPVILIAALSVGPEAGYLILAMRAMAIPLGLIGGAVSQVYLSRAADEFREGRLTQFTLRVINGLFKSGVGPLLLIGAVSPIIFPLIFGEKWQRAGELVAWMTPWFLMQFLTSPISMAFHVTGHQRLVLLVQLVGLVLRVGIVCLSAWIAPSYIVESFALSGVVFYLMYFGAIVWVLKIPARGLIEIFQSNGFIVLLWCGAGLVFTGIAHALVSR